MAETTQRPIVAIKIEWNPNTGALNFFFANATLMELLGIMQYAMQSAIAKDQKPTIIPASTHGIIGIQR